MKRIGRTGDAADFARFMTMVDMPRDPSACWEWQGNRPDGRYGHFSFDGKSVKAHRWLYELVVGQVPEGMVLRHTCDNPPCCNPLHLDPGTHAQNSQDMVERGRSPDRQGEKHPLARLTGEQVGIIRQRAACGESGEKIARDFPVSAKQVGKIVRRENWRHVA